MNVAVVLAFHAGLALGLTKIGLQVIKRGSLRAALLGDMEDRPMSSRVGQSAMYFVGALFIVLELTSIGVRWLGQIGSVSTWLKDDWVLLLTGGSFAVIGSVGVLMPKVTVSIFGSKSFPNESWSRSLKGMMAAMYLSMGAIGFGVVMLTVRAGATVEKYK